MALKSIDYRIQISGRSVGADNTGSFYLDKEHSHNGLFDISYDFALKMTDLWGLYERIITKEKTGLKALDTLPSAARSAVAFFCKKDSVKFLGTGILEKVILDERIRVDESLLTNEVVGKLFSDRNKAIAEAGYMTVECSDNGHSITFAYHLDTNGSYLSKPEHRIDEIVEPSPEGAFTVDESDYASIVARPLEVSSTKRFAVDIDLDKKARRFASMLGYGSILPMRIESKPAHATALIGAVADD